MVDERQTVVPLWATWKTKPVSTRPWRLMKRSCCSRWLAGHSDRTGRRSTHGSSARPGGRGSRRGSAATASRRGVAWFGSCPIPRRWLRSRQDHGDPMSRFMFVERLSLMDRAVDVEGPGHQLAEALEVVGQADEMVVGVAEVQDLGVPDLLKLAARESAEDLTSRRNDVTDPDHLALQPEDVMKRGWDGVCDDLVLDFVDLVGELIEDREVAIDDPVGERPQEGVRPSSHERTDAQLEL